MKPLTPKQEAFCLAYLKTGNASEAAQSAELSWIVRPTGFYVYFLIDPSDGGIFYVGKGRGRRLQQHVRDARRGCIGNGAKHALIQAILDRGELVQEVVFGVFDTENCAYRVERDLIERFKDGLTNIASGSSGRFSEDEKAVLKATWLLTKLKALSRWEATITPKQRAAVESMWGSLAEGHAFQVRSLMSVITGEWRSEIVCKQPHAA